MERVSACPICGEGERKAFHEDLEDHLFGAPCKWTLNQCISCGLVYLDPRPTLEHIGKTYTASYANRKRRVHPQKVGLIGKLKRAVKVAFVANVYGYKKGVPLWQRILVLPVFLSPYWREQLAFTVMRLPYRSDGRLLDIGCGIGGFLEDMSNLGWQAEGIDTDSKVVEIARSRGCMVKEGTLEEQSYPANHFDAITLKHVIEHVYDPIGLLKECNRILKPGGRLVVLTPNVESLGHKIFKNLWLGLDVSRHLFLFKAETLSEAVRKGGLKVVSLSSTSRISEFSWLVSYNLKKYNHNVYFAKPNLLSRFTAKLFDMTVRVRLCWDKEAGEELALVAAK